MKVKPRKDLIVVDGKKIQLPDASKMFWVALYKPKDVLTTLDDDKGRNTISTLVPKAKELRLLPVGGLDRQASGLLVLTNENGWIHPLTHPSFQHRRRYEVVVKGMLTDERLTELRDGVSVSDDTGNSVRLKPCQIEVVDQDVRSNLALLDVTLDESIPRQVERMIEKIACEFISLKRTEFGSLKLKGLRKGQWKELSPTEITKLKKSCSRKPEDKFKPTATIKDTSIDNLLNSDNMDRSIAPILDFKRSSEEKGPAGVKRPTKARHGVPGNNIAPAQLRDSQKKKKAATSVRTSTPTSSDDGMKSVASSRNINSRRTRNPKDN
jgi:23S rRNA pseudouridine2605 synthase